MSRRPGALVTPVTSVTSVTAAGTAAPGRPEQGLTRLEGHSPSPVSGAPS